LKHNKLYCNHCFEYLEEIARLKDQLKAANAKINKQQRQIDEGHFGSSTPSSKKPPQPNTDQENKNKGGAQKGHVGSGRSKHDLNDADTTTEINFEAENCPDCGGELFESFTKNRSVIDIDPAQLKKIILLLKTKICKSCKKLFSPKAPNVLPKFLYGNVFLAWLVNEHYIKGTTLGSLEKQTGVNSGTLISLLHKLAAIFKKVPDILVEKYKTSLVKHADETSWDYDGKSSYAWLFATKNLSIYQFAKTRSSTVVEKIFGEDKLPGVLVVDRYSAYNKANLDIQYCYAHLLRLVQDTAKEFPENQEVIKFTDHFSALLASAMSLRRLVKDDDEFAKQAPVLEKKIKSAVNRQANHAAIQHIQNIFREKENRLYHWVKDRSVPAENNFAERELRPLVISRKLSYGSHSDEGAKTREILMTVMHTLKKNCDNPLEKMKNILNEYAKDSQEEAILKHF